MFCAVLCWHVVFAQVVVCVSVRLHPTHSHGAIFMSSLFIRMRVRVMLMTGLSLKKVGVFAALSKIASAVVVTSLELTMTTAKTFTIA